MLNLKPQNGVHVTTSTDLALHALTRTFEDLASSIDEAWTSLGSGCSAFFFNLSIPLFNSVLVQSRDASDEEIAVLHDRIKSTGLPYSIQTRPGLESRVSALVAEEGLVRRRFDIPIMVASDEALMSSASSPALDIRVIAPDEISVYLETLATGYSMPIQIAEQLITPGIFALSGVRLYLGELHGTPVATGLGMTGHGAVGVFNISTIESERGKGFGAAITSRCAIDGFNDGAHVAYLQSSEMGESVYEGIGFTTTERWAVFETSTPDE
jgi:hypothetical protein